MANRNSKFEFVMLLTFLVCMTLILTNGFSKRLFAQNNEPDVYQKVEPIGDVLSKIMDEYVRDPDVDQVVQGALIGMMGSLDRHSSFIPATDLEAMREDTKGEFEGIGVSIKLDEQQKIVVFMPIPESPAAKAGLQPFDIITKIDDASTEGMTLSDAADKIRGQRGTFVKLTVLRKPGKDATSKEPETKEFNVKRDKVPLESVKEARIFDGGIGYMRISDFKDTTARDIRSRLKQFLDQGMKAFILDLRWNPGGLLTASKEVSELFLPKNSLVTYTKGRPDAEGKANREDMKLFTEAKPILPPEFPMIVMVNDNTASSSEIVTGALQFHQRALILGEKTFGKGSVQTIIPLQHPQGTALRLTTALYYTPADVTIDHQGILPDIEVPMTKEQQKALGEQMYKSYESDPSHPELQNHGTVTGNPKDKDTVEDVQLQRAVEVLKENTVWADLVKKYHRDVHETQVAAKKEPTQESLLEKKRKEMLQLSAPSTKDDKLKKPQTQKDAPPSAEPKPEEPQGDPDVDEEPVPVP